MFVLLAWAVPACYLLQRLYVFARTFVRHDKRLPWLITAIQPVSIPGGLLPDTPFHRGHNFTWHERETLYKDANLKTFVAVPVLHGSDLVYTSSFSVVRQVLSVNSAFRKPQAGVLDVMGPNVVTSEGETWRRHRRIAAPAFNHSTYRNVWNTTASVYAEMCKDEGWTNVNETLPVNINQITHKLALFLISMVGFTIPMSWSAPNRDKNGRLLLQSSIFAAVASLIERSVVPKWAYAFGLKKLEDMEEAFTTLEYYIRERLHERVVRLQELRSSEGSDNATIAESINDVFGRLVNARSAEEKFTLSDDEITGNMFIFAFAGHETTAGGLTTTLALLALDQDKQDWVYNSIKSALVDRSPAFEDFDALKEVLACFYEALRLYTPAYLMLRQAARDTTLLIPRRDDPDTVERVFVKKGTTIVLDMIGLFYDEQNYPEPESFKPERWLSSGGPSSNQSSTTKDTEAGEISGSSDAGTLESFIGFSIGPRTCLGHKFSKVEAVAFLTLFLRDWRVEPVLRPGETKEMWKARVLKPSLKVTLMVGDVPLKLVRRK